MAQFMKCLWLVCMAAVLPVSMNANASPQRIACNNFAELSVAVFQIRQDGNEVESVLEYANNNLKSEYPDHIFTLVTEMIKAAYKRPLISESELIPVGTAIIIVAAKKYAFVSVLKPTVYM